MLQNIRDNTQGLIAKFIIGLIIIPFALFGIDSLVGGGGPAKVATVNGEDITAAELQQAVNVERRRLLNLMGEQVEPELLDEARLRAPALERLIQQRLLLQIAKAEDIGVSAVAVDQNIINMQQFQLDGQFSPQMYENVLRSNGYTTAYFKRLMADEMLTSQMNAGVAGSDFVTAKEMEAVAHIVAETRSFRYLTLPKDKVAAQVNVTDEDVQQYYDDNLDSFMSEAMVKLDYIEVKQQDFFKPVSPEDLDEAYALELAAFQASEERRASHILVEITDDRDDASALKRIEDVAAKLSAGEEFAELAKAFSDDIGSAESGGDLGYTAGETFPSEFEDALFDLGLNQVSDIIKTDSGYHLIKATEINQGEQPSIDELKPVLTQRLQLAAAEKEFVTAVEDLRDIVFNSEGLASPAKELGLTLSKSDLFSRRTATGSLAGRQVLAAAFSDDVLKEGNNSPVIELAADHFIVVNVTESQPPKVKALAEVKDEIVSQLAMQQAIELSEAQAAQLIAKLETGQAMDVLAQEMGYEWQVQQGLRRSSSKVNREILAAVFTMPLANDDEFSHKTVSLANGDVVVVQLEKVKDGDLQMLSAAEQAGLKNELQRNLVGSSISNMVSSLRKSAEIDIL
ncbi:SurA N-terminal domain-containing protein [Oceanicoccus sp. KOV_DT_Chl]|uniref:SurA N-terminal domain-containing protein n=1 Tax=Oceanicoccus sp. KOV_DT_Chl TaxID=1904639 RepID=UPI000C7B1B09|nr:SurA N-terminal domain-containing protein [Oceanicoccus sp. KOV_DT_Chl]